MDESIFRTVSLFSVHSLISVIGQEQVQERVNALAVVVDDTAIQQIDGGVVLNEINGTSSVQADRATEGEEKDEINGDEMEIIDSNNNHAVTSVDENNGEENKNEDGNSMITEEVEEEEEEEEEEELSLSVASQSYDNGISFNGNFSSSKSKSLSVSNMTPAVKEKIEVLSRKSLQLLSQLCISEPALLKVLFSIYGAAASANKVLISADPGPNSSSSSELKKVELKVEGEKGKEDSSSSGEKLNVRVESKYTIVCDMIEAELSNIIPIISKRKESALIFSMLSSPDNDPYVRALLEISTEIMCSDYSVPANAELIKAVRLYTESSLFLRSLEGYDEFNNKNENSIENEKTIDSNNSIFEETKKTATLRMFFPLLGGFEYSELIALLPNLLISFGDQPEVIKTAFKRMFSARPPPLSRAKLFAALHR